MVPNPGSITWGMLENPQPLSQDLCTEGLGVNVFQSCSGHDSVRPALESLTASSDSITRGMMCVRQNLLGCLPCRSSDRPVQSAWAQAGRGQGICGLHRIPG